MPRPVKDEPRDCFKTFRFTEAELVRLEGRAQARGQTLSAYIRSLVLEPLATGTAAAEITKKAHTPVRNDHDRQALAEQMRRVGTNLNQIARRMNERRIEPPRELTNVLSEIRTLVRQAREP
jgi:hypothetical protein